MTVDAGVVNWALRALRPARHPRGPEHRSIMVVDIAGFGRWRDPVQLRAREALTGAMRAAFRTAGVRWSELAVVDRGDGMMVLVPVRVSKVDLLDPVVPALARILQQYNAKLDDAEQIRVRVAVHAGEIQRDASGWVGCDLNLSCRLVDAEVVREHLRRSPSAQVVLVVSDVIYQGLVRHGYRAIDPSNYTGVDVLVKEVDVRAWVTCTGLGTAARAPNE